MHSLDVIASLISSCEIRADRTKLPHCIAVDDEKLCAVSVEKAKYNDWNILEIINPVNQRYDYKPKSTGVPA